MKLVTHYVNDVTGLRSGQPQTTESDLDPSWLAYGIEDFLYSPTDFEEAQRTDFFPSPPGLFSALAPPTTSTHEFATVPPFPVTFAPEANSLADFAILNPSYSYEPPHNRHANGMAPFGLLADILFAWCSKYQATDLERTHRFQLTEYLIFSAELTADVDGLQPRRIVVNGSLDLTRYSALTELPPFLHVLGDLHLSQMPEISHFPPGLRVEGTVFAERCPNLLSLFEETFIGGDLNLAGCANLIVLEKLDVGGSLNIDFCNNLPLIPKNVKFRRNLMMKECHSLTKIEADLDGVHSVDLTHCVSLKQLPSLLRMSGTLNMTGCCNITYVAEELEIGESLILSNCRSLFALTVPARTCAEDDLASAIREKSIFWETRIGKHLDVTGCPRLKALPPNLKVGGDLVLAGCNSISRFPADISVGGLINTFACTSLKAILTDFQQIRGISLFKLLASRDSSQSVNIGNQIFSERVESYLNELTSIKFKKIREAWALFDRPIRLSEDDFITCLKICETVPWREQCTFFSCVENLSKQYSLNGSQWVLNISALLISKSIANQQSLVQLNSGPFNVFQVDHAAPTEQTYLMSPELSFAVRTFWRSRLRWADLIYDSEINDLQAYIVGKLVHPNNDDRLEPGRYKQMIKTLTDASEIVTLVKHSPSPIVFACDKTKIPLKVIFGISWAFTRQAHEKGNPDNKKLASHRQELLTVIAQNKVARSDGTYCSPEILGDILRCIANYDQEIRDDLEKGKINMLMIDGRAEKRKNQKRRGRNID